MLREQLYSKSGSEPDDVRLIVNSYGGYCNAATQMFDIIRDYPAHVHITVSGTAASAATVLCMAADTLEMTPASLWMVHNPSTFAYGNERELEEVQQLLRACKESIINVYALRCNVARDEIAAMMTNTTWMDSETALKVGFIDRIATNTKIINATKAHILDRQQAEAKVNAYFERQHLRPLHNNRTSPPSPESHRSGISHDQLHKRLHLIRPTR